MAHHFEKQASPDKLFIIDEFQNGISGSPHAGIADMKNININSFPGEAAVNFARNLAMPVIINATTAIVANAANTLDYHYGTNSKLMVGSCFTVTGSTITGLSNATRYWVKLITSDSGGIQSFQVASSYNGATIASFGVSGTATPSTIPIAKFVQATNEFIQSTGTYRYWAVDVNSQIWANDPSVYGTLSPFLWSPAGSAATTTTNCQGMGVTQGVINVFVENQVYQRYTNRIGDDTFSWQNYTFSGGAIPYLNTPAGSTASHRALRSQVANGSLLYCDSQFIGLIQATSAQFTLIKVTSNNTTTLTASSLEQGVTEIAALPVSVYAPQGSSVPSGLTEGTQYYVVSPSSNGMTFGLATTVGGSAISVSTGTFYMTSFVPSLPATFLFDRQALALPYDEQATALAEISVGQTVNLVVGGMTQNVYFWDESSSGYTTVRLPEGASGTSSILNVNNSALVFAGNKGDCYLTNASGMAGTLTVPDYCANPNGGNQDPYFVWGATALIRGRVFFSIQDQTSSHTGNCGGIWSFIPPQNGSIETNIVGTGLHLENESSYGTYNGVCDVLLPSQNQKANGPQYWSFWTSDVTTPTYGIDYSSTIPYTGGQAYIDTDLVEIGSFLEKGVPINFEYKLARPLVSGESVQISARPDLTSSFTLLGAGQLGGTGVTTTVGALSDVFISNVQNTQWIQLRVSLTSTATNPSYVPLTKITVRIGT